VTFTCISSEIMMLRTLYFVMSRFLVMLYKRIITVQVYFARRGYIIMSSLS